MVTPNWVKVHPEPEKQVPGWVVANCWRCRSQIDKPSLIERFIIEHSQCEDRAASEAGRALAALRPRQPFTCEACGREYTAVVKRDRENRACSSACRSRLFREQKRASRPG